MADAAGVAEGTLFTVFDDKRALIMAVLEDRLDPAPLTAALAAIDAQGPLRDALTAAAAVVLPRIEEVRALASALHGLPQGPRRARDRRHLDAWGAAIRGGVAALLRPHAAELRWPPERLAELFTGLLFVSRPPWTPSATPFDGPELVDVVLHGAVGDRTIGAS
jgi:AcrR family transcriptional regulator